MALVRSPVLQGAAFVSLKNFFQHCVVYGSKVPTLSYSSVFKALLDTANAQLPDQCFSAVAQCVAAITTAKTVDTKTTSATVSTFIKNISSKNPSHTKVLSLLSIGEIGRVVDLASHKGIEEVIFKAFGDKDIGKAASFALGSIAVGDMKKFLPILMHLIKSEASQQFLLLSALKDCIKNCSSAQIKDYVDSMLPVLYQGISSPEEGTRDMVAECLGFLAAIDMYKIMPHMQKQATESKESNPKVVFLTALRIAFNQNLSWGWVCDNLDVFLKFLTDEDLIVRQEAVTTVTSLINCNSKIISRERLADVILPALYAETKPHAELLKKVSVIGFTEIFDPCLTLRKAVFISLGSLLNNAGDRINLQLFIENILPGFDDHDRDIFIFTIRLVTDISKKYPAALTEYLDEMPGKYLLKYVKSQIKSIKEEKQDEKSKEKMRIFFEGLFTWSQLPGVEVCSKYCHFVKQIQNTAPLLGFITEAKRSLSIL